MKTYNGFTLIELVMFIVITSLLASAILLAFVTALGKAPVLLENTKASQAVEQCLEFYLGQRRLNGYNSITCTSPLSANTFCTAPANDTLVANCVPTTISGDSDYKTITVTVTGAGYSSANLLLGLY